MFFDGQKLLVTWLKFRINIMAKIEISSIGAKPIENPNIPAGIDDGNDIEKLDFSSQYTDPDNLGVRTYTGTEGADTFEAEALLNGNAEVMTRFTRNDGTTNWEGVAGKNGNYHDHWIEGPGEIVIENFGEGDQFLFKGHTATTVFLEDSEGVATIGLISDQTRDNIRGNGAHDFDVLGKATIYHDGSFNYREDVKDITKDVFDAVDLSQTQTTPMEMSDGETEETQEKDTSAGDMSPTLEDTVEISSISGDSSSTSEDTMIEISSIGAKPVENPNIPAGIDDGNDIEKLDFGFEYTDPDDLGVRTYTGTEGANTFQAEALLNGKSEILTRFTRNDGTINWEGVAGKNDNYHDHWIEGPGEIVIENFGEGDQFLFKGHTATTVFLEDSEGVATIGLISDQTRDNSRGNGAHDFDVLGKATIYHDGSFDYREDVQDITKDIFDAVTDFS